MVCPALEIFAISDNVSWRFWLSIKYWIVLSQWD